MVGRLDVWLEPYFQHHMEGADDPDERRRRVTRVLELCCALVLKLTDHLPFVESAGNRIFSGSSGNQVLTLGGVTDDGGSAVCDMTWIWLKVTEMLRVRDPNVNARFAPGVNSEAYLRRLCEVNLLTGATPSLHNDDAVIPSMVEQGFALEHARDWTATGCVEPTSCGRHLGHTNSMMFNMVAALEMALNDGVHPLVGEQVGPSTGNPREFRSYGELLTALKEQLGWLIDRSARANNMLGRTHQRIHPTPLMSSLFEGPMESGRDVVRGGARYNSSGTALVGLTDVVDSLAAIRALVFDEERVDMGTMLDALAADFVGYDELHTQVLRRAPKFGQDAELPLQIARDLMDFVYDRYQGHEHYRGGRYVPGYWSMSYHVAFGDLSGALPSGRRRGESFTPGLTPSQLSGAPLTEQIRTVASLDAHRMPNNIAFNVKVVPGADDSHHQVVDRMAAYVGAYFEMGGMQIQFNVVGSDTLKAAMETPDEYRDLDELTALLLRDEPFYRHSGGGVTLSGGEPTLFPRYSGELAARLAPRGVHVLLETCGHFEWSAFERHLLPHLSAVYFDLKLADENEHRRHTGRGNVRIRENLERLVGRGDLEVLARIPLVPGITDGDANLRALAALLLDLGLLRVALMPYNPLWVPKREALGFDLPFAHREWMEADELERCAGVFLQTGVAVVGVGGDEG